MKLKDKKCDCVTPGKAKRLSEQGIQDLLKEVKGWRVVDGHHLTKEYTFPNYQSGVDFVNKLAAIAEEQQHHPDILLRYGKVRVSIYTHVIDGLSDNDFILAAKYDTLKK